MRNIELFCDSKIFQYDGYFLKKDNQSFEQKGEGLESIVYKIDDQTALKVYREISDKARLNKKEIQELSTIDTKRIILPNDIITTKNGEIKGYSMDYIEESNDKLEDFSKKQLVEELKLLKEDLITLGKNNVEIGDLREENTISNKDSFYLIDCGDYLFRDKDTTDINLKFFNSFFIEDIFTFLVFEESKDISKGLNILSDIRDNLNKGNYIGDLLEEELQAEETLTEYVKRKAN